MIDWPLVTLVWSLPILGVGLVLLIQDDDEIGQRNIWNIALFVSGVTCFASLLLWAGFSPNVVGFQHVDGVDWWSGLISYKVGIDGLSVPLVALVAFVCSLSIFAHRQSRGRAKETAVCLLMLQSMLLGFLCALDAGLAFMFLAGALAPLAILMGLGDFQRDSEEILARVTPLFILLFASTLPMFLALLGAFWDSGSTDIEVLQAHSFDSDTSFWLALGFFATATILSGIWPFHSWLTEAVMVATPEIGAIVAGLILGMGSYILLRFGLPIFPEASKAIAPMLSVVAVISVAYACVQALIDSDLRRAFGFVGLAQIGLCILGIASFTHQGVQGGHFLLVTHTLIIGSFFFMLSVLEARSSSFELSSFGGLVRKTPKLLSMFTLSFAAVLCLPGTAGFVGSFLALSGLYEARPVFAVLVVLSLIVLAASLVRLYRGLFFGPLEKESLKGAEDINAGDIALLFPFAFLIILLGIAPGLILEGSDLAVTSLPGIFSDVARP